MLRKSFRIVMLMLAACLLVACSGLRPNLDTPQLSLVNVSLLNANLFRQSYGLRVKVMNPNGIALPIRGISYNVSLAGSQIASGVTSDAFRVPANGENEFDIRVDTNLIESAAQLAKWLRGGPQELDYEFSGKLQIDLPLVGALPFSKSGSVPFRATAN